VAPRSDLTATLERQLGAGQRIVDFASEAAPHALAALAPMVTAAAQSGDGVAVAIMARGAARLGDVVVAMGWTPGLALMLTGGLAPTYAPYLGAPLRDALAEPKGEPIDGALELAGGFARGAAA
ncbi:MAG: ATPase, partial [Pseudomonadota bacterium]